LSTFSGDLRGILRDDLRARFAGTGGTSIGISTGSDGRLNFLCILVIETAHEFLPTLVANRFDCLLRGLVGGGWVAAQKDIQVRVRSVAAP